jgi:hypothetical protein
MAVITSQLKRDRNLPPHSLFTIASSPATCNASKQAQTALAAASPILLGFAQTPSPAQETSR